MINATSIGATPSLNRVCLTFTTESTSPGTRRISIDAWLIDQSSHSYVAALAPPARNDLLGNRCEVLTTRFPNGEMTVRYETWLRTATKR